MVASVSTRLVPFPWGTAYLNDGYRERWDSNFLWVDPTAATVPDAAALAAEADRVLGDAGLTHREIRIDDDAYGRSVSAGLARAGYGGRPAGGHGAPTAGDPTAPRPSRPRRSTWRRSVPRWRSCCGASRGPRPRRSVRSLADFRGELRTARRRALLLRAGGRRDRGDVRALRPGFDRADRGREHARGVPQPRAGASGRAARGGSGARRRRRPGVPARARRRLAEGAVRASSGSTRSAHVWSFVRPSASAVKSPA